jgi:hypothetical protein
MYLHSVVRHHDSSFVALLLLSGAEGGFLHKLSTCVAVVLGHVEQLFCATKDYVRKGWRKLLNCLKMNFMTSENDH